MGKPRQRAITFCAPCGVTYSARRQWCDCGAPVSEGRAPAWLTCGHCGEESVESQSGLFFDDHTDPCMTCGMPGHVEADDGHAHWSTDDHDDSNVCVRVGCDECAPYRAARVPAPAQAEGEGGETKP